MSRPLYIKGEPITLQVRMLKRIAILSVAGLMALATPLWVMVAAKISAKVVVGFGIAIGYGPESEYMFSFAANLMTFLLSFAWGAGFMALAFIGFEKT